MPSGFSSPPNMTGSGPSNNPMGLYSFMSNMMKNMTGGSGINIPGTQRPMFGQPNSAALMSNPNTSMSPTDQEAGNTGPDPNKQPTTGVPIANTPSTTNYGGGIYNAPSAGGDWLSRIMSRTQSPRGTLTPQPMVKSLGAS